MPAAVRLIFFCICFLRRACARPVEEPSWGLRGLLGGVLEPLGGILGPLWGFWAASWGLLGASWGIFGTSGTPLGASLGASGAPLDASWWHSGAVGHLGAILKLLGKTGNRFCEDDPRENAGLEFVRRIRGIRGNGISTRGSGPHFLTRRGQDGVSSLRNSNK